MFKNIIGHKRIKNLLQGSVQSAYFSHAYLFVGVEHLGKFTLALEFAKELIGIEDDKHPDILILKHEKNIISIKAVRELQRKLNLSSYKAKYKIAIIDNAHFLRKESANALLKTLEEPPKQGIIILIANSLGSVLPTIVSRCQIVKFWPVSNKEMRLFFLGNNISPAKARKINKIAHHRPGIVLRAIQDSKYLKEQENYLKDLQGIFKGDLIFRFNYAEKLSKDKNIAQEVLKLWILNLRVELLKKQNKSCLLVLKNLKDALYLLRTNANARLVLENMMLNIN